MILTAATAAFWTSFEKSANVPTVLMAILAGVLSGILVAVIVRRHGLSVTPILAAVLSAEVLVVFQVLTAIGQSANQPTNTQSYIAGHLSFSLLSVIYGLFVGVGVKVAAHRWALRVVPSHAGV